MRLLYTLSVHLYHLAIQVASLFNRKAELWVKGRKNSDFRIPWGKPAERVAWFHCASLGEFEQGRSLIGKYRAAYPAAKIVLTFFSPSGYEVRKNHPDADLVLYLPIDTRRNARCFVNALQPSAVFFIKYEFWFNYLAELRDRNIPVYLVSGIFRKDQYFFKSYGAWFRKQLGCFTWFFVQDEGSAALLNAAGYGNVLITGDTRFDRVMEIAASKKEIPLMASFQAGKDILIAGSTWEEDEALLSRFAFRKKGLKLIIAPHEVSAARIDSIVSRFPDARLLKFSEALESNAGDADILLIDNIGYLSSLYQYGNVAWIGGGFGKGIHNILEAATFGLPVVFGPNYRKFKEANELIRLGGAFSVSGPEDFTSIMNLLNDKQVHQTASMIARNYVSRQAGATEKIMEFLGRS